MKTPRKNRTRYAYIRSAPAPCWLCVEGFDHHGETPNPATCTRVFTNDDSPERRRPLCDQCAWGLDDDIRNAKRDGRGRADGLAAADESAG